MEAIFPISALSKDTAAVRDEARHGVVRITENGRGAYIFCSESVFEEYVNRQVEDALFERRLTDALDRAMADVEAGRMMPAEEGRKRVAAARGTRGLDAAS